MEKTLDILPKKVINIITIYLNIYIFNNKYINYTELSYYNNYYINTT